MSGTQSQSEATSQTNPLRESLGWVAKHSPRIDLGHEGMMLESIQRGLRIREVAARNELTGDRQNLDGWPGEDGDDKMGVNIGDHIHYHQAAQQATPPTPQPSPTVDSAATTEEPSLLSKALPWVVAAGLGVGGYMLGNKPVTTEQPSQPQQQTQPVQPQSGDKWYNDKYGIRLEHYVPETPK